MELKLKKFEDGIVRVDGLSLFDLLAKDGTYKTFLKRLTEKGFKDSYDFITLEKKGIDIGEHYLGLDMAYAACQLYRSNVAKDVQSFIQGIIGIDFSQEEPCNIYEDKETLTGEKCVGILENIDFTGRSIPKLYTMVEVFFIAKKYCKSLWGNLHDFNMVLVDKGFQWEADNVWVVSPAYDTEDIVVYKQSVLESVKGYEATYTRMFTELGKNIILDLVL